MSFKTLLPLLATAGAFALPAGASADTLLAPAPGATNLAGGGGYLVWSAPAAEGGFQLTVRAPDGRISTPSIPRFDDAPDAVIGSDRFGADGRKVNALYSRGGDIYAYDLQAGTEAKVKGASTRAYDESAPGISYGRVVFVRKGGRTNGIFSLSSGKLKRIATAVPAELAFNGSRVAYPTARGVVLHRVSGKGRDSVARGTGGRAHDIVLNRYSVTFLTGGGRIFQSTRFGGSSDVDVITGVKEGSPRLPAGANSFAFDRSFPRYYLDAEGLKRISKQNLFR
jgi:hypothetical protein